jgi:hypothetical protein
MTMKARLLSNSLMTGHLARSFIRLTESHRKASITGPPHALAAHDVLEAFGEQRTCLQDEPGPPVKGLVKVLNEGLRGIPNLLSESNGKIDGARLYVGCSVRVLGLSERRFVVREILWDCQEVRIQEVGTYAHYIFPWDCLRLIDENAA